MTSSKSLILILLLVSLLTGLYFFKKSNIPSQLSSQPSVVIGEVDPYRVTDDLIVIFQLVKKTSNISEVYFTTDLQTEGTWQPFSEFIRVPQSKLGESGNIYVKFRDSYGNESEVVTTTINPKGPPTQ